MAKAHSEGRRDTEIRYLRRALTAPYEETPFPVHSGVKKGSRPISRVLSWATIPLGCTSPCTSSGLPGNARGPRAAACAACFPIWPCSRRGFQCRRRYRRRGALLPHLFTLAVVLAHAWAVYFLLHFPWARAPQALPGAVPCGARTFLCLLAKTAIAWPTPATNIEGPGVGLKRCFQADSSQGQGPARRRRCAWPRSVPPWLPPRPMPAGISAAPQSFHRYRPRRARFPAHPRR